MTAPTALARRSATQAHADRFPVATAELDRVAAFVIDAARQGGATAAETDVSQGIGQSVTVRKGEVETIAYNRDKGVSVTVYVGRRRGHASTADFSDASIRDTVDKALAIARYTAEDPCAGLADADRLARDWPRSRPLPSVGPDGGGGDRARARGREAAALAVDTRLTNSEGASGLARRQRVRLRQLAGLLRRLPELAPRHRRVAVIGEDKNGMQRDFWYTAARAAAAISTPRRDVGRIAGERTARRLGAPQARHDRRARCCSRRPTPPDLIGAFVHAVSGGSLYRKSSFLLDSLGTEPSSRRT